jgi:hypothetical protein
MRGIEFVPADMTACVSDFVAAFDTFNKQIPLATFFGSLPPGVKLPPGERTPIFVVGGAPSETVTNLVSAMKTEVSELWWFVPATNADDARDGVGVTVMSGASTGRRFLYRVSLSGPVGTTQIDAACAARDIAGCMIEVLQAANEYRKRIPKKDKI